MPNPNEPSTWNDYMREEQQRQYNKLRELFPNPTTIEELMDRPLEAQAGHMADNPERALLCQRLRQARLRTGLTQDYVADHAGISRTQVCNIELGRCAISDDQIRFFARLYGVKIGWLFGEL